MKDMKNLKSRSSSEYFAFLLFFLLALMLAGFVACPASAGQINVQLNNYAREINAGALSLNGTENGGPETTNTNTNTGPASIDTTVTTQTDNSWVVDVVGSGDEGSFLPGTNQITQIEWFDESTWTATGAGSYREVGTAGSYTMYQEHCLLVSPGANCPGNEQDSNRNAHVVASFAPASGQSITLDNTSGATDDWTNSLSWSHPISAGGPRKLLVGIAIEDDEGDNVEATEVTYNGHSLTRVAATSVSTGDITQRVELWYLDLTPLFPTPLADYHMDSSSWDGDTGEVIDSTGNGYNGTAINGAQTNDTDPAICGDPGTCNYGTFDGIDDYIEVSNLSDLLDGTASLAFWIKTTQPGDDICWQAPGVTGVEEYFGTDDIFWGWIDASGHIGISVGDDYYEEQKSDTQINDGTWHHVALSRNASSGETRVYIDGTLEQIGDTGTGIIGTDFESIGRIKDTAGSHEYFDGNLDEVRIYDEILTELDVKDIMSSTRHCPSAGFCPPNNIFSDGFEDGDLDNPDWSTAGQGDAVIDVNEDTAGAGCKSMFLANGTVNKDRWQSTIDLSGATSANLSIWVRRGADSFSGYPEAGQNLILEYRNSNNDWRTLQVFEGGGTPGEVFEPSYSLPEDALHSKFNINFRLKEGSASRPYYWHVDNVCLTATTGIDHFGIYHDGHAVNCQRERVTIEAHYADHSPVTDYTGTVNLSTNSSHGDWSTFDANGSLTNYGSGQGTYDFADSDNGTVDLGLRDTYVETVDINATDGSITENSGNATAAEDRPLQFERSGFEFTNSTTSSQGEIRVQISGKPSSAPPNSQDLQLMAVNSTNGTDCEAALNGTVDVEMAFECIDPVNCTSREVSINGTSGWEKIPGNDRNNVNNFGTVSLDFGDQNDATAPFDLKYPDAGKIKLHARYELLTANGTSTGNYMRGPSKAFVVRPFGFHIDIPGNPGATNASGDIFTTAGKDFNATLSSVVWESGDDTDEDGIPDSNAGLANNTITPNFGQESTPESATLTHNLFEPSSGHSGSLSGGSFTSFSNGNSTQEISWNEVGIISLNVTLSDNEYLGSGQDVIGSIEHVGRFIPDRFRVRDNSPGFGDGCIGSGFTYLGQEYPLNNFSPRFTINATNTNNNATQNYDGDFWKLSGNLTNRTYSNNSTIYAEATNGTNATLFRSTNGSTTLNGVNTDYNGTEWITLNGEWLTYEKPVNSTRTFQSDVYLDLNASGLTDSDGVCYDPDDDGNCDAYRVSSINGTQLRYGRAMIENAYGSELLPLKHIKIKTQYYNSTSFQLNTEDNCSPYNASKIDWTDACYGGNLTASNITASGEGTVSNGVGEYNLYNQGNNTGYVDYKFPVKSWLRYPWNSTLTCPPFSGYNGTALKSPYGRATFGIYKGSENIIYQQETTWK